MDIRVIILLATADFIFERCYGSTCSYVYTSSYSTSVCDSHWWGKCWHQKHVTRYRRRTGYRCCHGYHGSRCNTPICIPACENHKMCVSPNHCEYPERTARPTCEEMDKCI